MQTKYVENKIYKSLLCYILIIKLLNQFLYYPNGKSTFLCKQT